MPHTRRHRAEARPALALGPVRAPRRPGPGGMLVFSCPAVAWVSQYNQSGSSRTTTPRWTRPSPGRGPARRRPRLQRRPVRGRRAGGQHCPHWLGHRDQALDYESILSVNPAGLMARLRIPASTSTCPSTTAPPTRCSWPGSGHLQGTSLPVGGRARSVITGHRAWPRPPCSPTSTGSVPGTP